MKPLGEHRDGTLINTSQLALKIRIDLLEIIILYFKKGQRAFEPEENCLGR